ncbi:MAG: hypothetical protein AB7T63_04650 [Planctomycetota bacterium]
MPTVRSVRRLAPFGLAAFVLGFLGCLGLAACGVGGTTEPVAFELTGVGPGGGVVEGGEVRVNIPAGALAEETLVSILPQALPFPIQPLANDPCTYEFLGPIWCVGPVGTELTIHGVIRLRYDPSLIPAGIDPADLVLLVWDEGLGAMVPTTLDVVHDAGLATFTFDDYAELGHVAVGIRTCLGPLPNPGWVIPLRVVPAATAQVLTTGGIYVGDADQPAVPPTQILATDGALPEFTMPSLDGQTVLFGQYQPSEDFYLFTVPTAGAPSATPLPSLDEAVNGQQDLVGWWLGTGGSTDVFFSEYVFFGEKPGAGGGTAVVGGDRDGQILSTTHRDGASAVAPIHQGYSIWYLDDLRQAEDGEHVLLVWGEYDEVFRQIVEVIEPDGTLVSSDLVPYGGGLFSPRFVPTEDAITRVADDQRSVLRCDYVGGNEVPLLTLPANDTRLIQDFVIDPTGTQFLALVRVPSGNVGDFDEIWFGTYSGDVASVLEIEQVPVTSFFFDDLVWHPNATNAYLGMQFDGTLPMTLSANATAGLRITFHDVIPTPTLGHLDVNRIDGRILVTVVGGRQTFAVDPKPGTPGGTAMFDQIGVWVADPDGANAVLLAQPQGTATDLPARWLASWRRAPGTYSGVR